MRSTQNTSVLFKSDTSLGYLINSAARLFAKSLYFRLKPYGLGPGEWPVLVILWEEDGLSQGEISRRLKIEDATIVRTIDRLEKKDWVKRVRSKEDRRYIHIQLTQKAKKHRKVLIPYALEINQLAVKDLSEIQQTDFKKMLKQIIKQLEDDCT